MIPGSEAFNEQNLRAFRRAHQHVFHKSPARRGFSRVGLFIAYCIAIEVMSGMSGHPSFFYDSLYLIEIFIAIGIVRKM